MKLRLPPIGASGIIRAKGAVIMEISVLSPAKLNLMLRVLFRRPDGYHEIFTLFQRVDLADNITFNFERGKGMIKIECDNEDTPTDESNLICRAINLFREQTGVKFDTEVRLEKRTPIGGGMGGGSSNAAAALEAVNTAAGSPLDQAKMMHLARRLGADVPFFIFKRTAWAAGIGDRLYAAPNIPKLDFIIVTLPFQVSAAWAYKNAKIKLTKDIYNIRLRPCEKAESLFQIMCNDFEDIVAQKHPRIEEAKRAVVDSGADCALMSGSGPTVFGAFADRRAAEGAYRKLERSERWRVWHCRSIDEYWGVAKR